MLELENLTKQDLDEFPTLTEKISYCDFYKNFISENIPCLIQCPDLISDWNSVKDWKKNINDDSEINIDFFRENFDGELVVPVSYCEQPYFNAQKCGEMTLSEYLDYLGQDPKYRKEAIYLKDWHFCRDIPSYQAYTTPEYFTSDWLNEYWDSSKNGSNDYRFVYMGPAGSWTPFHSDVYGSFSWSVNIVGLKEWIFMQPEEELKLKDSNGNLPYDVTGVLNNNNNINVKYFRIQQKTGEIIFVPSGWYHQVRNLKDTISINHNWFNAANIHLIMRNLFEAFHLVTSELSDIKEEPEFPQECQKLLSASHGMNFDDFVDILEVILNRRLNLVNEQHKEIDVQKIYSTLKEMLLIIDETIISYTNLKSRLKKMIEKIK